MKLRDKFSKVNSGLILSLTGSTGILVFDSWFYAFFAVAGAVGAVLIFGSQRRDSTWSFSLAAVLGSWTLLMLNGDHMKLVLTTGLIFSWFLVTADIDSTIELYNTGKTGKAAKKSGK
ncbi:MAG: hypothetical protein H8Z69_06055 [Nanohaloarchaea archaeon]|nr:hypothetical protein [Candidatus Nanohaloarchaea archaeon]